MNLSGGGSHSSGTNWTLVVISAYSALGLVLVTGIWYSNTNSAVNKNIFLMMLNSALRVKLSILDYFRVPNIISQFNSLSVRTGLVPFNVPIDTPPSAMTQDFVRTINRYFVAVALVFPTTYTYVGMLFCTAVLSCHSQCACQSMCPFYFECYSPSFAMQYATPFAACHRCSPPKLIPLRFFAHSINDYAPAPLSLASHLPALLLACRSLSLLLFLPLSP